MDKPGLKQTGNQIDWVAAYASLTEHASREHLAEQLNQLRISRSPSRDNLFVDVTSEADGTRSRIFLHSLLKYELQQPLQKLEDGVGLARLEQRQAAKNATAGGGSSMFSCIFTLVASAVGAGCLSLPHMLRESGLGLGLIMLFLGALLAHTTLVVLISCARYTECRSFAELVALTAQSGELVKSFRPARSAAVDLVISMYGVAAVLIYLILIGDFLADIAHSPFVTCLGVTRRSAIVSALFIVLPLSLVRSVTKLQSISVLSTTAVGLMTLVVFVKACLTTPPSSPTSTTMQDPIVWFQGDLWTTLKSFSIAIFAFNAHTNAVPVALALERPRASRIWQVCAISVGVEFLVYVLIAVSGYWTFRSVTKQDFIRNYRADDTSMFLVRCMYSVPILFGIPINLSPAAASIKALVGGLTASAASSKTANHSDMRNAVSEILGHTAVVTSVLACCAVLAIRSSKVADAIGFFGGLFGTLLCLWWPERVYATILGGLHPRSLRIPLRLILPLASAVGLLAFMSQFWHALAAGAGS
mmetsp:Transcript_64561/g.120179  ORF Transcript_64561/g.120179 Transcript_64561/m.120179 type:complete len:531 (-) Transcript_64561:334-1926(-)